MSIRRCDECQVDWPAINWTDKIPLKGGRFRDVRYSFEECPQCLRKTRYVMMGKALSKEQVRPLVAWARFERFYETWDAAREQKGDPSPEALGRLEAKEIFALELVLKDS